jgi:hypothetical protein
MSFESKPTGLLKIEKKTKKTRKSTDTFPDVPFPLLLHSISPLRLVILVARVCPAGVLATASGGLGGRILGRIRDSRRLSTAQPMDNVDRTKSLKRYSARLV